jgi:hypothetical protein
MAEWLKAAVLKTVSGVTRSGVRIPLPPPVARGISSGNVIANPFILITLVLSGHATESFLAALLSNLN